MEDTLKAHLEKVWTEYIEYKEYIKDKVKNPEQLRQEVREEIKTMDDVKRVEEILFEKGQKNVIYQADFNSLLTRLYHTVEAYKDVLDIPKEITDEASKYNFNQLMKVKNGREVVVNQEAVDTMKKGISENLKELKKFYNLEG